MRSPADILLSLLESKGLVTPWTGFVSYLPDTPAEALCVYDTAGMQDGRILSTGERIEHPGFQIRLRGADYAATYGKAAEIASALDTERNVELELSSEEAYIIRSITRTSPVLSLGMEDAETSLFHFTINGTITLAQR